LRQLREMRKRIPIRVDATADSAQHRGPSSGEGRRPWPTMR
jgi:hypothetical protein